MVLDPQHTFDSLRGIRDMAIMLNMANSYLCEKVFLQKAALTIDHHLRELNNDILSLKKQFPGKFTKEVDTEQVFENIYSIVNRLNQPDEETLKKCNTGTLGLELENSVNTMAHTIGAIQSQVKGELGAVTRTESVLGSMGWIKSMGYQILNLSAFTFKLTGAVVLVSAILFIFFYYSMDSQENFLKEINENRNHIQKQLAILSENHAEKERLNKELDAINEDELSRQDKTRIIDLSLEIHEINEQVFAVEAEIEAYLKKNDEMEKRIEELNRKPFLKKLFRL